MKRKINKERKKERKKSPTEIEIAKDRVDVEAKRIRK